MRTPPIPAALISLAAAALAAAPARAARLPAPQALLDAALTAPTIPYEGRVMVTQWYGRRTRAEELRVYSLPPKRERSEFLSPDGNVVRVLVSNGDEEAVTLVRARKTVLGHAAGGYEKVLPADQERAALLANYELLASTGDNVAGRPTWRLTLKPRVAGKSWQTLWLDRETRVVLRNKRYLPRRHFASQAEFIAFEPGKAADDALFDIDPSTSGLIKARGLAPKFLTRAQLKAAGGGATHLPDRLPGGFVFESADVFPVMHSPVRQARYTDGLTALSLFQTDRPVRLPRNARAAPGTTRLPGPLDVSLSGNVLQWSVGARHYTLMGDVSRELMARIAKSFH
ncbi:MAG: hypothetical protein KGM24_14320 [Elusimicrobia bacterium]|nr:hypothetical protein [Elusimicrobiota bacterium]